MSRILFPFLLLSFLLSSCDSSPPQTETDPKPKGAHHSTATLQLHPSPLFPSSDRFIANQIAILTSGPLIQAAAEKCNITPEALSSTLKIEQIPNTDLLTITAYHDDEKQPKANVKTLLDTYRAHRKKIKITAATGSLKALDQQIRRQSNIVQKNQKDIPIRAYGIPHFDGNHPSPLAATEEQMFQSARQKLADFETQRDQIEIQIKKLAEMPSDDLVTYASGLDLPENQVTYYFTQHREALKSKRELLASGRDEKDPDIIAIQEKADGAMQYAEKEATTLVAVLKTKLALINRQVERMNEMVKEREEGPDKNSINYHLDVKYNLAKATYEKSQAALQAMNIKQQEQRDTLSAPSQILTIHGWVHE